MNYTVHSADIFVRDIGPPRMNFIIGKGQSLFPEWMRINAELRLELTAKDGTRTFGFSADWPSFGWLDKRGDVPAKQKLLELLNLAESVRKKVIGLTFKQPFDVWWKLQSQIQSQFPDSVPLCRSFCIALAERAIIDAFCRIQDLTFHQAVVQYKLGIKAQMIHSDLADFDFVKFLPTEPLESVYIRHTVGPLDPITASDITSNARPNDSLPHTLEDYVQSDGITYFKIKICGDPQSDITRLQKIWSVIKDVDPVVTLDGNESFDDTEQIGRLIDSLSTEMPDLFEHIRFIEQPVNRAVTLNAAAGNTISKVAQRIPLIIDEADGYLHAFSDAIGLGYTGVSHKNCKGIFKSLCNFALCQYRNQRGAQLFQSAEDLTNMPLVALHQDFIVAASLGLEHIERNGHHFFGGLQHLSNAEQQSAIEDYPNLYRVLDGHTKLNIVDGKVDISSLQNFSGLGVAREPDWNIMQPLKTWLANFKQTL